MNDDEVLTDCCWAFAYLSDDSSAENNRIQAVLESGAVARLVKLLAHRNPNIKTSALRACANVVTGNDVQTQAILDAGLIPALTGLLGDAKRGILKETVWCFSNITAGNSEQIQLVIDAGAIPPILQQLERGEHDIQKEAAWVVGNFASGCTLGQIQWLMNHNALQPIVTALKYAVAHDAKIVLVLLECIKSILQFGAELARRDGNEENRFALMLEDCGGLDVVEGCQQHENEEIYQAAVSILSTFFTAEDEDGSGGGDGNSSAPTDGGRNQNAGFSFEGSNDGGYASHHSLSDGSSPY